MRVLYPGGFDLVHHGHVNALNTAKQFGHLTVGINSDRLMTSYKRAPKHDQNQRIRDVKRLGIADDIIIWDGPEGQDQQILDQQPDVYVASADWINRDLAHQLRIPELAWFSDHRINLMYVWRTGGVSTTQLIQALERDQA